MKVPVSEIVSCNIVRMIIKERKKEIMFNVCVFANIHSVMWADKIQKIDNKTARERRKSHITSGS